MPHSLFRHTRCAHPTAWFIGGLPRLPSALWQEPCMMVTAAGIRAAPGQPRSLSGAPRSTPPPAAEHRQQLCAAHAHLCNKRLQPGLPPRPAPHEDVPGGVLPWVVLRAEGGWGVGGRVQVGGTCVRGWSLGACASAASLPFARACMHAAYTWRGPRVFPCPLSAECSPPFGPSVL